MYVVRKTFSLMVVTIVLAIWTLLAARFSVLKELLLSFLLNLNTPVPTRLEYSCLVRSLSAFFVSLFKCDFSFLMRIFPANNYDVISHSSSAHEFYSGEGYHQQMGGYDQKVQYNQFNRPEEEFEVIKHKVVHHNFAYVSISVIISKLTKYTNQIAANSRYFNKRGGPNSGSTDHILRTFRK